MRKRKVEKCCEKRWKGGFIMGERMDQEAFLKAIEADIRKSFHESIDTTLSGLQENPYLYHSFHNLLK